MQKNFIKRKKNIRRYPYRLPRKNGQKNKQSFFSKIVIQLLASAIILIVVLGVRSIDAPVTNTISDKIENSVLETTNMENAYEAVETFKNKINIIPKNDDTDSEEILDNTPKTENENEIKDNKLLPQKENPTVPAANQNEDKENILSIKELEEKVDVAEEPQPIENMISPVDGAVSSYFGMRKHPLYNKEIFHSGVDIDADKGTNILAVSKGEVIDTGKSNTYGNYIRIQHNKLLVTFYAHCNEVLVEKGDQVEAGDVIGKVGNTGNSSGSHLHFEIIYDGKHVNPLNYIELSQNSSNVKV